MTFAPTTDPEIDPPSTRNLPEHIRYEHIMSPQMTSRFALKAATDDIHRELDERLSSLDLAKEEDYRRFLQFQARSVPSVEQALASAGLEDLVDGWCAARRSKAIEADLQALGGSMPEQAPAPAIAGTAQLLGTAYVVEGSRLGSRVLRRRVAAGLPVRFLSDDGSLGPWPTLIAAIDRLLDSDNLLSEAKEAARRSFSWFLQISREAGI